MANHDDSVQSTSHKDKEIKSLKFELEVIENTEKIFLRHASIKLKIDRKRICEWSKQKGASETKLQTTTEGDKKKRLIAEEERLLSMRENIMC